MPNDAGRRGTYGEAHVRVPQELHKLREFRRAERQRLSLEPQVDAAINALIDSPSGRLCECFAHLIDLHDKSPFSGLVRFSILSKVSSA
jgi:hypothetical protein